MRSLEERQFVTQNRNHVIGLLVVAKTAKEPRGKESSPTWQLGRNPGGGT
jgi:hypothetical protein